jgi:peptidyl-prolyl cis-trans isomerase B (cyclophilin B)
MGIMIKRIVIASALVLSVIVIQPSAQAAPKSVACKASTAVGHTPMKLDVPKVVRPVKNMTFKLKTNCGEIVFKTYGTKAPLTVTAMSYLANNKYFDNSICHRIVTSGIFIIQCGDPTASGSGGPAWSYPDENLPQGTGNTYPAGTVAMANSGPNTNGSQFFFTFKDGSQLGPNYTIWGKVTKGLDILQYVASKGIAADGIAPAQALSIISEKAS